MTQFRSVLLNWVLAPKALSLAYRIGARIRKNRSTLDTFKPSSRRLYVLGNGPSLTKDLEQHKDELLRNDRMMVNFSAAQNYFEELRPNLYLLVDPQFFASPELIRPALRERMNGLFSALFENTSWKMTIIVPSTAMFSSRVLALRNNPNISIVCYDAGVEMPFSMQDFPGMARNRYKPPTRNVLNTAVYLGVYWRYPETILLGADTSFHSLLRVDQETNRLYREDEHYYGSERVYLVKDIVGGFSGSAPCKLSDQLEEFHDVFSSYEKLRQFADWQGVRVLNASSFSWIDSFERLRR